MENNVKVVGKIDLKESKKKPYSLNEKIKKIFKPIKEEKKIPIIIHFFRDKGGKIVGRMDSGKIAIIDFSYKGKWINENEDWQIEIVREEERKVIIYPLKCIISAQENDKLITEYAQKLKDKNWNKPLSHSISPIHGKNTERRFKNIN
jgi:hypothetical protein